MTRLSQQKPPRFWWRGGLILLPVAVLAAAGLWQLRYDRMAAMQSARESAQDEAGRLRNLGAIALQEGRWPNSIACKIDPQGAPTELDFYENPPLPSTGSQPADRLNAAGGDLDLTRKIAQSAGDATTASGLPVAPLAARKALQLARNSSLGIAENAELLCRLAVVHPSVLSEVFLDEAAADASNVGEWRKRWHDDESLRRYFGLKGGFVTEPLTWTNLGEEAFLNRIHSETLELELARREDIRSVLSEVSEAIGVGPYVALHWKIGGEWLSQPDGDQQLLAEAGHAELPLQVSMLLADPQGLLRQQSQRTRQMSVIIGLAALAAAVGWWTSWRAFRTQLELARMKDNFASSVSHELRAPIASIRIMSESLESGRADGEGKREEYARLIAGESARLGSLVENVLAFSRLEAGTDAFELEDSDAVAALRAAVDLMRPAAIERGITLRSETPSEGELGVVMDSVWIGRALVNLLDNAIKYGPANSEVVAAVATVKGGVCFSVIDRGEPIPAVEHDRIFDKFYRRGSELNRETQGVGIGLSLVRNIAEAHAGRVWIENGTGGGNHFNLEIGSLES